MKARIIWPGCVALLLILLAGCTGKPQVLVEVNKLELGDVVNGEVVTTLVEVENRGEADLVIERVTTSCGCTQATIEPMRIPPDGNGTLSISFDSGAHGPELTGQLFRQVFVSTNDPDLPEVIIDLEVNILPPEKP